MRKKLTTSLMLASVLLTGCLNTDIGKVDRDAIDLDINPPQFSGTNFITVNENQTDIAVMDFEYDGDLTYEISGGADSSKFTIDSHTGALSFKSAPDFENPTDSNYDNIYEIVLKVTDANSNDVTQNITVQVENIADVKPKLEKTNAFVSQNSLTDVTIAKVKIVDSGDSKISSMTLNGEGSALFEIAKDGTITLKKPLDKVNGESYELFVNATNDAGTTKAALIINVTEPDLTPPSFTSSNSISVNENISEIADVKATDSGFVTYSLVTGSDSDKFTIDAQSGKLSFKTPADFENPTDGDLNNIYEVTVMATDSVLNEATQNITVTVNNIFDVKPVIKPLTLTVSESIKADSKIGNIIIQDSGDSAISSITLSGDGSENFSVDTQGALTLKKELSFAQKSLYTLNAAASNSAGSSDPVSVVINVTEVTDTLPSTGQITSKADFDDGYYKRGIEKSFTRDDTTDIVTDNLTYLQWQDINYNEGVNKDLNYTQALAYCEDLTQGGYDDWRVPTIEELVFLTDKGLERVLDKSFGFIDYPMNMWSSTASSQAGYRWALDPEYGKSQAKAEGEVHHIKCVRGASGLNGDYVRDDQAQIVKNDATNLIWQDDLEARTKSLTWLEALNYCESLELAGKTQWRLPNFNELYSIIDRSKSYPAVKDGFQSVKSDIYWSSTPDVFNEDVTYVWTLNFGSGADDDEYAGTLKKHYVRCVHSIK